VKTIVVALLALAVVAQFIRPDHTNPPVNAATPC
jgi:hypothetical protein